MMRTITENNLTWVDIEKPIQKDMDWLKNNFNFHKLTLEELIPASSREKVEKFPNYLFLVMYVPVFNEKKRTTKPTELDILITKDHVITIHNEPIEPLGSFLKKCEIGGIREDCFGKTSGHLVYYLVEDVLSFAERQLVHVAKNIERIEDGIFKNIERDMIKEISFIKRDVLDFRIAIKPMHRVILSLVEKGKNFWAIEDLNIYFNDLLSDYERVWSEADNYMETINALEATNTNLLNDKTNAIVKTFTILSFITFPTMLIITLLQVDTVTNPIRNMPQDFWVIVGFAILTVFGMWLYFKTRKWL